MFSVQEMRGQMARKGYTQKELAKAIGISSKTMSLKMKTGKFGTDEVERIMGVLEIENPLPIFFAEK